MAKTLIDPPQFTNPIAQNHNLLLKKSIDFLLTNSQKSDNSSSLNTFHQLIQSRINPPLESIWVYSYLVFSTKLKQKNKFSDRVSCLNELFGLISICSATCDSYKSIALLAPVVFEVHRVIIDVKNKVWETGSKKEKKLMKKIESVVKSVLGFISVCCSKNGDEVDSGLGWDEFITPLENLIRVWIGNEICEGLEGNEIFKIFFPILGDEVVVVGVSELAGAVIAEAFLLRLCLDLCSGVSEEELRAQAVGSITGFRNFYFFETLVKMLLEQCLPVASLLSPENEVSLRKVLLDAVILPEYSFLNPETMSSVSVKSVLSLSISRVVVTHEATELFRKNGDLTKALSYDNAFTNSGFPSQLVKVVSDKVSTEIEVDEPKGKSPKAILNWLHKLMVHKSEDQGITALGEIILKFYARIVSDKSEAGSKISKYGAGGKDSDLDDVFYIDNKGKVKEEREKIKDRKRKKRKSGEKKRGIKYLKVELINDSGTKPSNLRNNEMNSESEVENPTANDVESE